MERSDAAHDVLRRLLQAKRRRRRELADLTIEEKLEILSRLQAIAKEISIIGKTLKKT